MNTRFCQPLSLALLAMVLSFAGLPLHAETCFECRGKMVTDDIGHCRSCNKETSSGMMHLCPECSAKEKKCELCGKDLKTDEAQTRGMTPGTLNTPPVPSPVQEASSPIEVTEAMAGKVVQVLVGQHVKVKLAGNPTTGYSWSDPRIEGEAVTVVGKTEFLPTLKSNPDVNAPQPTGSGGTYSFAFEGTQVGTASIDMVYRQPWEKGAVGKTFHLNVDVRPQPEK